MDKLKIILLTAIALSGFLLWNEWTVEHTIIPPATQITSPPVSNNTIAVNNNQPDLSTPIAVTPNNQLIDVKTKVLDLKIDPQGGNIVQANLLDYTKESDKDKNVSLFTTEKGNQYFAQSTVNLEGKKIIPVFKSEQSSYNINTGSKEIILTAQEGLIEITKTYTIDANQYLIALETQVTNNSSNTMTGSVNTELTRQNNPQNAEKTSYFQLHTYTGGAYSTQNYKFKEISFEDMDKGENINFQNVSTGWVAMMQHYFVTAWIPDNLNKTSQFYSQADQSTGFYTIGSQMPLTLQPKKTTTLDAKLYVGPAINSLLQAAAPNLNQTIGYGWAWIISSAIFWLMSKIYSFIGNWGWSIVFVTIIIKLLFYKLSASSYRSMKKMKKLQPKITALREKYADDKQAQSKAMMDLYRHEKFNPLGGCLPVLVQIPIFLGLYYVVLQSVELRQAPFIFWIHDLSLRDPYYILPLLMGASMFLQQRLSPPPADPTQAKVMMFLPVMMTALFLQFQSGLVLYMLVNILVTIIQQWYIMNIEDDSKLSKTKK